MGPRRAWSLRRLPIILQFVLVSVLLGHGRALAKTVATITSPKSGATVSGIVPISVTVLHVSRVSFYVGHKQLASSSPYTSEWNSTTVPDGRHIISVKAYSAGGKLLRTASVHVHVKNGTLEVPSPTPTAAPSATPTPDPPAPTATATPTATVDPPAPTATATVTATIRATPTPTATPAGLGFYVSMSTGSDSNSGTSPSSPWQTISKVIAEEPNFTPGTTIYLLGGDVWHEELTLNNLHGTGSQPITFTSYGTGRPVIDGNNGSLSTCISADQESGTGLVSYITINGFECRNTSEFGINFRNVLSTAMPGIVIENNYIHNTGAGAYGSSYAPYDDSHYANQLNAVADGNADGFQILNNIVNHCGGHNCLQVHYDHGGPVVSGNVVGPGCVHNCIDLKGVVNAQVLSNTATCPQGFAAGACSSATAAFYTENEELSTKQTMTYESNVAYDVPICFQSECGSVCSSYPINDKYYNNTCYNPSQFNWIASSTPQTLDIQKNIVDGSQSDLHTSGNSVTWNYNDDLGITGNPIGSNDISVDPQFFDAAAGNFAPQNSTVLNAGAPDPVTPYAYLGGVQ